MAAVDPHHARLEPWGEEHRALLHRLQGDPVGMTHLGGIETPEQIDARQDRYNATPTGLFAIVDGASDAAVGFVGYWEDSAHGATVFEMGWALVAAAQGRGLATAGVTLATERARADGRYRWLHAYPAVSNPSSNALCERSGFSFVGEISIAFPPGTAPRPHNNWRLDLRAEG